VAKAVLGVPATSALIERLDVDKSWRRILGWERRSQVPSEAKFSRPFAEFAQGDLPDKIHAALIERTLGDASSGLVGWRSRPYVLFHCAIILLQPVRRRPSPAKPSRAIGPHVINALPAYGSICSLERETRVQPRDPFVGSRDLPEKPIALQPGFTRKASKQPALLGADRLAQKVATADTNRVVGHGVISLFAPIYGGAAADGKAEICDAWDLGVERRLDPATSARRHRPRQSWPARSLTKMLGGCERGPAI
jgi:hypothetical protein